MKTAVFILDCIPSHVYATAGLARRLMSHGFRVEYWGNPKNQKLIEEQGFFFRPIEGLWSRYQEAIRLPTAYTWGTLLSLPAIIIRKSLARRRTWRAIDACLDVAEEQLASTIRQVTPSFVVLDPFMLAYFPFLRGQCVPTAVLSTKPIPSCDPLVPPYSSFLMPPTNAMGRLAVQISWLWVGTLDILRRAIESVARALSIYTYSELVRRSAQRNRFPLHQELVRRWIQPDLHFRSSREWAMWSQTCDLPRERPLPPNICYIGPCVDNARMSLELPFRRDPTVKYLIYVAVGTVRFRWRENVPFLRKVIGAFEGQADMELIISTGDERATRALGTPPANVKIFDFVPQLSVLQVADLVITHGGAGTFRECVHLNVPMLAYPRNHDQPGNSARIVSHGIGLRGRRGVDSPITMREKATAILSDPSFRANLNRLSTWIQTNEDWLLRSAVDDLINSKPGGVPTVPRAIATRSASIGQIVP